MLNCSLAFAWAVHGEVFEYAALGLISSAPKKLLPPARPGTTGNPVKRLDK